MRRFYIAALIILSLSFHASAQEAGGETVLELKGFLINAVKHGSFKEILMDELSLKYNRILGTPQLQLLLDSTAQYKLSLDSGGESSLSGDISLSSLFPSSGTTVSAEYDTERSTSLGLQTSAIALKVEQSVLKNAFGSSNRLKEMMAGNEETLARYQILESYEDYLAQVIDIYLEWDTAYRNMKYAQKYLEDSRTLLSLTKRKQQYGIALPLDVNKSTLQVLNSEEQLNQATNDYETARKKVIMLSGIAEKDFTYVPGGVVPAINDEELEKQNKKFLSDSRTVKMLDLLLRIGKQQLNLALDDLLPTATVYASYNLGGADYLPLESTTSDIKLGFSLSVPLLNTQAQAKAEIQKNTLDKTIVSQLNQKEQLELQLHTLMQTIVFLHKQLALAEQKLKTAQLIVQQERRQYNQGRAGLDDLINAYQTLDTISQARLATMGQLTKNYIEWLRFTDSLIDDNHQITDHGISHD